MNADLINLYQIRQRQRSGNLAFTLTSKNAPDAQIRLVPFLFAATY